MPPCIFYSCNYETAFRTEDGTPLIIDM